MFFLCFFEGIQFLAFSDNKCKNVENGKSLGSFFKYSPNIYSQNLAVRNSVKKKFIPVLFSWYFFHYVNARHTMRYYIQRYIKTFQNNETIKHKHQTTFNNEFLCSEGMFHSLIASQIPVSLNSFRISSSSPCICLYRSTIQLAWSGFKSGNLTILWCLLGHQRFLIAEELDLKTSGRIGF